MERIANLELSEARELVEFLKRKSITTELRTTVDVSGIEFGEVLVNEQVSDHACDITETWDSERRAAAERMSRMWCHKCSSHHLELVPNDKLGYTFRCKDCGCEFDS